MSTVPDLELAAAAAMIQAHETAKVVDQDAVMELQTKLEVRMCSMVACTWCAAGTWMDHPQRHITVWHVVY